MPKPIKLKRSFVVITPKQPQHARRAIEQAVESGRVPYAAVSAPALDQAFAQAQHAGAGAAADLEHVYWPALQNHPQIEKMYAESNFGVMPVCAPILD